jgi:hypothetical protein
MACEYPNKVKGIGDEIVWYNVSVSICFVASGYYLFHIPCCLTIAPGLSAGTDLVETDRL